MDKKDINERFLIVVNKLLLDEKLNKAKIADKLNISRSKFSEILNKRMNAGIDSIALLCEHYNISSQWILLGTGDMFLTDDAPPCDKLDGKDLKYLIDKIITQAEEIGKLRHQLATLQKDQ